MKTSLIPPTNINVTHRSQSLKRQHVIAIIKATLYNTEKLVLKVQESKYTGTEKEGILEVFAKPDPNAKNEGIDADGIYSMGFFVFNKIVNECFACRTPKGALWTVDDNVSEMRPIVFASQSDMSIRNDIQWFFTDRKKKQVRVGVVYRVCADMDEIRKPWILGTHNKGTTKSGVPFPAEFDGNPTGEFMTEDEAIQAAKKLQEYFDSLEMLPEDAEKVKKKQFEEKMVETNSAQNTGFMKLLDKLNVPEQTKMPEDVKIIPQSTEQGKPSFQKKIAFKKKP